MIFVAALLISGPLFFRSRVGMAACPSRNQCAMVPIPGELFRDAEFRTVYHALWAVLGTFLPLIILLGTSCGLVMVLYRSRTAGIASPDRYPCTRVTATVTAIVVTYLLLVCPSTLNKVGHTTTLLSTIRCSSSSSSSSSSNSTSSTAVVGQIS